MKYNYQPRLKIYHKTLGKFDLIDKYNTYQLKYFKSIAIKIFWDFNNKIDLTKLLFKEFLLQQRFRHKKILKRVPNTFFTITIRKNYIYLYFEMLINTYFINNKKIHINNFIPTILFQLSFLNQNKFFNCFNNNFSQFDTLRTNNTIRCNFLLNIKQSFEYLNYHFLPTDKH